MVIITVSSKPARPTDARIRGPSTFTRQGECKPPRLGLDAGDRTSIEKAPGVEGGRHRRVHVGLLAYASLWFYVGIASGLLSSVRELVAYGFWIGELCIAGLSCFYFWPTAMPPQALDLTQYPGFSVLQGMDAAANACPSMHVATAAFSAIWLDRLLGEVRAGPIVRAANWCWFVLIAYSTLAIKQHVALDVAAGLLLGTAFALPSLRFRPASFLRTGMNPGGCSPR